MTFQEWLANNPIHPRVQELQDCWNAAQAAVAELKQQPVAWAWIDPLDGSISGTLDYENPPLYVTPLYTRPPRTEPVALTGDRLESLWRVSMNSSADNMPMPFARAILAAQLAWHSACVETENEALRNALHNISLASQDSGSTREGMGLYARAALAATQGEKK